MSAKELAEARRARILAKSASRMSIVQGEAAADSEISPNKELYKERPLASRRSIVASSSNSLNEIVDDVGDEKVESSGVESINETSSIEPKAETTDKTDESPKEIPKIEVNLDDILNSTAVEDELKASAKLKKRTPQKSVKEIEEEIARNTALFDEQQKTTGLTKETPEPAPVADGAPEEKKEVAPAPVEDRPVVKAKSFNISQVMRIVRCFVLILLGFGTGYRCYYSDEYRAISSPADTRTSPSNLYVSEEDQRNQAMQDYLSGRVQHTSESSSSGRTWGQFFTQKFYDHLDTPLSAVGLVWWSTSLIQPVVDNMLRVSVNTQDKKFNIMDFVMNIQSRVSSLVFGYSGEISLHMTSTIATVLVLSVLNSEAGGAVGEAQLIKDL